MLPGNVTLSDLVPSESSVQKGSYHEPFTTAQAQARDRSQRFQDCIDAARNDPTDAYTVPPDHLVAVITNPGSDLFGWPGRGAFLPVETEVGAIVHETGHGLGLNHSFPDDPNYRNADWAQIGEYDDQWDVMSYANVYGVPTSRFGYGGPGLNAYHLDRMGWLSRNRILTFGADGTGSQAVTLAALNHPESPGFLQVLGRCIQGYVWREAFPGDQVCVLPATRAQAASDNAQASSRLLKP